MSGIAAAAAAAGVVTKKTFTYMTVLSTYVVLQTEAIGRSSVRPSARAQDKESNLTDVWRTKVTQVNERANSNSSPQDNVTYVHFKCT